MKKLLAAFLIILSIVSASVIWSPADVMACEHYFQEEVHNGQRYLVEYNCDGAIISMMPIED